MIMTTTTIVCQTHGKDPLAMSQLVYPNRMSFKNIIFIAKAQGFEVNRLLRNTSWDPVVGAAPIPSGLFRPTGARWIKPRLPCIFDAQLEVQGFHLWALRCGAKSLGFGKCFLLSNLSQFIRWNSWVSDHPKVFIEACKLSPPESKS